MTRQEAEREARRRWGVLARVADSKADGECYVFHLQHGLYGKGQSWEDAFADADHDA